MISGLPYTSLMPRKLASFFVRRYGRPGGIYGDSIKGKEKRGYYTYTYGIRGYQSLFKEVGFNIKSYWAISSYNNPDITSRIEDKNALKGYLKYFNDNSRRFKLPLFFISKLSGSILGKISAYFTPSFLFYCYKHEITDSFDELAKVNIGIDSFVTLSTGNGVMYIFYDKKHRPYQVVHAKRTKYIPEGELAFHDKTNPNSSVNFGDSWKEHWITGRTLNPLEFKESEIAIRWLFEYQEKNRSGQLTKKEIDIEVKEIYQRILLIPEINVEKCAYFLEQYQSYLNDLSLSRTNQHGDFFFGNMIFNTHDDTIKVIDWEHFSRDGDPFLIWHFIY